MATPTQARVRALFNYDPETGILIWRSRPRSEFKTEAAYRSFVANCEGKEAGHVDPQGYRKAFFDGILTQTHKIAWLIVTGEWVVYPEAEIDHDNGDRSDNRIENLRKATKSQNQRNAGQRVNNTSGVHGVNWKPRNDGFEGRWVARIWNGPRHIYLGVFASLRDAQIARKAAERALGYTGTEREPKDHKAHALQKRSQA
ncbi:HNH endonuclease signature motif containing protein [Mesorhizobium sp. B263B2A]|uniref:HNH endonuclease signature motif containing protein n=1 Tax=Mesorhizobium sp. B263B2A TaxID=2876669 RepID=UPI001CD0B6F8|nr:HNH endonuclease signature motif containing protein [Mesorhizobium sp. B263B2A]MCA0032733.1 HNH endonuclease [Mesorhizobium sp. B263B2A]